ncbi:MAG: peptidoglycan DD-metalloendopeptidase family protein [Gammaproteobacteria bacterium]
MEIILLSKRRGRLLRLAMGKARAVAALAAGCALLAGAASVGYERGTVRRDAAEAASPVHQALARQRQELIGARAAAQRDIDALALRMGSMQAHITRLNALGERLAASAGLRVEEFNFNDVPGIGGPDAPELRRSADIADLTRGLEQLSASLRDQQEKLAAMEVLLTDRRLQDSSRPSGGPVPDTWISSGFGERIDPLTGQREFHRGVDFSGPAGTRVLAVAAGVVTWAGYRPDYGHTVEVNHGNGFLTRYSHNRENLVAVGAKVERGQSIALLGASGRATGPHVHFEVERDGIVVNPVPYIAAARR